MNSKTRFKIGDLEIGGDAPVVVQSMTNTDTTDVKASVVQCRRMVEAGAQMIRLTVPSLKEVESMRVIRDCLRADGVDIPLVADVHFNPKVAEAMASIVEKVRINPGNYVDKRNFSERDTTEAEYAAAVERMTLRAEPLLARCKQFGTAIRVGINHGSLCDRIVTRYGNTPRAMVQSALEWIDICERYDFHKVVISMKSSNVHTMIDSTMLLYREMEKRGVTYPLHLGVTEAGSGLEARAKSAAGIGALLMMHVGDTVRVSLTEPPENEPPFAHKLLATVQSIVPSEYPVREGVLYVHEDTPDRELFFIKASAIAGYAYYNHHIHDVKLVNRALTDQTCLEMEKLILQACRIKMSDTEFIACPSCGRTQYDIQRVLAEVKRRMSGHPGLKIGVMGCIVNGPGEMADADYGIVGASHGLVCLYEGKKRLTEPISVEEALNRLIHIIK